MPLTLATTALSPASFLPFGFYGDMLQPGTEKLGAPPIEFFRDMVQQDLGTHSRCSFSTCRVEPRPLVIDVLESHSRTMEVMLPLDNDMLLHVAPATANGQPDLGKLQVFRVPRGVLVAMRAGIWHHGPFACHGRTTHILVALPERTYANDTCTYPIAEPDRPVIAAGADHD